MDALKSLLKKNLQTRVELQKQVATAMVVQRANELIAQFWGKQAAREAKAISCGRQCLTIHCENSMMAQELNFQKKRFLDALAKILPTEQSVKRLRIVIKQLEENEEPC